MNCTRKNIEIMCPVLSFNTSAVMWRTYSLKITTDLYSYGRSKLEHSFNTKEPQYIHVLWCVSWIGTAQTLCLPCALSNISVRCAFFHHQRLKGATQRKRYAFREFINLFNCNFHPSTSRFRKFWFPPRFLSNI
jgi:hypothetical protein